MTKPKFEIGQKVHFFQIANIIYEVIVRRWDSELKRRSFEMKDKQPGFQYLLSNGRFIKDGLKLRDGTTDWIDECQILSQLEMAEEIASERSYRRDDLYFDEPDYDGDTGRAFINGRWISL